MVVVRAFRFKQARLPKAGPSPTQVTIFWMSCWVYVITSQLRPYIYVGLTYNVPDRIARHNSGRETTTEPYRPFALLLSEEHIDRPSARLREKYLKSGQGKEYLKRLRDNC